MKRKFRTRISCLLIASLCIGLLSATALAADPAGTAEEPTVTETVTTDTKQDTPAPGQTTTTTTTEKTWEGTTTEDGTTTTVDGKEKTTDTTVTGPDGDLLDRHRRGQRDHDHHTGRGRSTRGAGYNGCCGQQAGWQRGSDRGAGREYK